MMGGVQDWSYLCCILCVFRLAGAGCCVDDV